MASVSSYINHIIAVVGYRNLIIIGIIIVLLIIAIIIYRSLRLKVYRQEIVEIENHVNGIKSLPIQYRLGRVKSIAKNMGEVAVKYTSFAAEFERLSEFQQNELGLLMNDVDEQLFYGKIRGVGHKINELKEMADEYDRDSKALLAEIEKVTEIENEQRIEIIKVKEKYRTVVNAYDGIRVKVESFVPELADIFKHIDDDFVKLEGMMNNQLFADAKTFTNELDERINMLSESMKDLPSYVSVVKQLLPSKIHDIEKMINELADDEYALEKFDVENRYDTIVDELSKSTALVKDVQIQEAGVMLETLTDHIESLAIDLNTERESFVKFQKAWMKCKQVYEDVNEKYEKALTDLDKLSTYYIINENEVTLKKTYREFKVLYDSYKQIEEEIISGHFSYSDALLRVEKLNEDVKEHSDHIADFNAQRNAYYKTEQKAIEELENINIVLLETKSEIKNRHLPMINDSYKDYIQESYAKASGIQSFRNRRPISVEELSEKVKDAKDIIYKLYDNVHNLVVTAEMVEEAIVYGNRYRSTYLEVNTELTKAEVLFRNGEYTKALQTAVDIIEKIQPGSYERLIKKQETAATEGA